MCDNPRYLRNPVKMHHRTGYDKPYIIAVCGQCAACRKAKSRDWSVRTHFEKLAHPDTNSFFVSLDFDNDHLPKYKDTPCFDSEIIKKWLKRLRYYIGSFRYFYATDYGGFLQRPHYHVMIEVPKIVNKLQFFEAVANTWQCGSHSDIECIDTVNHDPIKAVNYVAGYVTKDILFDPGKDLKAPARYRPRVQASKGWGLTALEDGLITTEDIKRGSITLPLGSNGTEKTFPIPDYYVRKYTTDSVWLAHEKKCEQTKTAFGLELQKIRHNSHYEHYLQQFIASRHLDLTHHVCFDKFKYLFPETDFSSFKWHDLISQCFADRDNFLEFLYHKPFLHISLDSKKSSFEQLKVPAVGVYYLDAIFTDLDLLVDPQVHEMRSLNRNFSPFAIFEEYLPNWKFFSMVCLLHDIYRLWQKDQSLLYGNYMMHESAKHRARLKLKRNPQLYRYLIRKKFDFSKLRPSPPPTPVDTFDKYGHILYSKPLN